MPYFARYAYEVYVAPKRRARDARALDDGERRDLAAVLRDTVIRFDNLWKMPFPYVMALHQAPTRDDAPRLSLPHRVPSAAAPAEPAEVPGRPEIGGGNFLSDTSPEEKAAELRAAGGPHYLERAVPTSRCTRSSSRSSALHARIRDAVVAACERGGRRTRSRDVAHDDEGDTIYAIDRVSEDVLVDVFERTIARDAPVVWSPRASRAARSCCREAPTPRRRVGDHRRPDRRHARPHVPEAARVDPDRRRARIARRRRATLADIELAVQTEIPLVKQHLCDQLWAVRGQGASRRTAAIG